MWTSASRGQLGSLTSSEPLLTLRPEAAREGELSPTQLNLVMLMKKLKRCFI